MDGAAASTKSIHYAEGSLMGKLTKELGDIVASVVYPSYADDGAEEANDCNGDELGKLNH